MPNFTLAKIYLPGIFFFISLRASPQTFTADTLSETSLHSAVNLYHNFLSPETGLYNGSQYTYAAYYPFPINEGDPFFQSKEFSAGAVFYNNLLYENVPLLFDIIKGELLIKDPTRLYIIKLNAEKISWFTIWGQTFIKLLPDSTKGTILNPGFYDLLYNGHIILLKKVTKTLKENSASIEGINDYVVESDEYFIKKNNQYYKIKNKKSLMSVVGDKKKEIGQFIKKNRLSLKKNTDDAFKKILSYYDELNNNSTKAVNK